MADLFDYLKWRGDLLLSQADFGPVDNLILASLIYVPFENVLDTDSDEAVSIAEVARRYAGLDEDGRGPVRSEKDEELLMAAEYIMSGGNENIILCERGIRTFETATRNTLDLSAIPVLHELTHLPVVIDPSHATGVARYVKPMALAAAAAGCDGLIIEVHNDPPHALCDGAQSLRPEQYEDVARAVNKVRAALAE